MHEPQKHTKWKKPNKKTTYDSIYMQFQKKADPYRKKIDQWLPGAEEGMTINKHEETSWVVGVF